MDNFLALILRLHFQVKTVWTGSFLLSMGAGMCLKVGFDIFTLYSLKKTK